MPMVQALTVVSADRWTTTTSPREIEADARRCRARRDASLRTARRRRRVHADGAADDRGGRGDRRHRRADGRGRRPSTSARSSTS
ncbi:MAG: hypothetical protein MZV65_20390 [Chromatiales bacterium]|nr:hypothetical protein [Chromatiales bacterium]